MKIETAKYKQFDKVVYGKEWYFVFDFDKNSCVYTIVQFENDKPTDDEKCIISRVYNLPETSLKQYESPQESKYKQFDKVVYCKQENELFLVKEKKYDCESKF